MMRLASWVSMIGIVAGAVIMAGSGGTQGYSNHLTYAAGILAGGMMISSGMISLAILSVFGKNNDDKK